MTQATCESHGHLYGFEEKCIFCKEPKPPELQNCRFIPDPRAGDGSLVEVTGMTKSDNPCIQNAHDLEPLFVLRAQDRHAALFVRRWAIWAKNEGLPQEKYEAAMRVAEAMDAWPTKKDPD